MEPSSFYHVYNRSNNKEDLFRRNINREAFLEKLGKYLNPFLKIFAYCLMNNHFHLLVQVRNEHDILKAIRDAKQIDLCKIQRQALFQEKEDVSYSRIVHTQFQRFFTSYSRTFNAAEKRKGNLLNRPFKRILVDSDSYFNQLIYYIHSNPLHHGTQIDFHNYDWSSYKSHLSSKSTFLEREEVISWFGNRERYIRFHQKPQNFEEIDRWLIE